MLARATCDRVTACPRKVTAHICQTAFWPINAVDRVRVDRVKVGVDRAPPRNLRMDPKQCFLGLMVVVSLLCNFKWKSKPFAHSAEILFGWFWGLGT